MSEISTPIQNGTEISRLIQNTLRLDVVTSDVITSVIMFSLVAIVGGVAYFVFERYFSAWAKKTETTLDDDILRNVKSIAILLIIVVGSFYAFASLTFTAAYSSLIYSVFTVHVHLDSRFRDN